MLVELYEGSLIHNDVGFARESRVVDDPIKVLRVFVKGSRPGHRLVVIFSFHDIRRDTLFVAPVFGHIDKLHLFTHEEVSYLVS